ncbi:MAG: VWA domain-containing protein [Actinomycetia bacterium]|nr:VWA domain-containing protein [Actinomycetes bacterium]
MAAGLLDRTVGLVQALRGAGVPVSVAESLDAVRAVGAVGLLDREAVRAALAAALVKRGAHRPTFDALFDLWFPALTGPPPQPLPHEGTPEATRSPQGTLDAERGEWRDQLTQLLLDGDDAALRAFARAAVEAFGHAEAAPGRQSYFSYRVLRALSPDTLVAALIAALLAGAPPTPFREEVARRTAQERVRAFEQHVDAEIRRRLAEEKGPEQVARTAVRPLVDQVEFLRASREDLATLRRQVHPLARRLATCLAARRRSGPSGRLDMRRTVRASLGTGGVPVQTHHRPRRPHKPELVVLCDVSGSVASFAHFTLLLTWALQEQFTRVRAFAFIDTTDEVTRFLERADDLPDALAAMTREAQLVWYDGHSDYGHAFEVFAERYADAITPRTSLLVLGDGRTNYRNPGLAVLAGLAGASRHAYWLNPEPRGQWGSGDSAARRYADVVPMVECRTVAQLERFLTDLPG